ncbi:ATP-dependent DNA helicase PIF1, partial [Linum perenne]
TIDNDGFPRYRRLDNDRHIIKNGVSLDNRFVVPYNRYLLLRFNAHINVEYCNKSRAIKYLFKYITKPPDRAMDELANTSMLLEWMNTNRTDPEARKYTFVQFPQYYVWDSTSKSWRRRKKKNSIARLYYCQPSSTDRFYLRMLLHIVKGCSSFEDILTVNQVTYHSFKEACNAYGFLTDDGEWNNCLREVSFTATGRKMRMLFVTIIMYCDVSDVGALWMKNWELLSDDIQSLRRRELKLPHLELSTEDLQSLCLVELGKILRRFGRSLSDFPGMPTPHIDSFSLLPNTLLAEEMQYDHEALKSAFQLEVGKLNTEQRNAYDQIITSVEHKQHQLFFVDGFGGTGKTFLWQVLSMKLRSEKKVVICVATSGIAALLMTGGRTAHSRFHIPIDVDSTYSELAELIHHTSLIIWDEAPMAHKHCIESLDRTLRDVASRSDKTNGDLPFGGITIVFGGDFRQTLPIISKGSRTEIVNSSIKRSKLWDFMNVIQLTENMRLKQVGCTTTEADDIASFSNWILGIGNGVDTSAYGDAEIKIPRELMVPVEKDSIADIVQATYTTLSDNHGDYGYFAKRAILAPFHEIVSQINSFMLDQFPGEEMCYYSSDTIQSDRVQASALEPEFPTEFLNSLDIGNFPAHELKLKVGVPVILLRNLDQTAGLCNGTRMIIKTLGTWFIEVEILTGTHIGERVYLPRLSLTSLQKSLDFTLMRRQYPIALSFAMTINKSQGQTLNHVGICLKRQIFTHGQLYVALSRVTKRSGLSIMSCDKNGQPSNSMTNIVFREVLD